MNLRREIREGLPLAALTLLATGAVLIAQRIGLVDGDAAIRLTMAVSGGTMVWLGNQTPKRAAASSPLAQKLRRFNGWALVLGGLANIAIWTFAPMSIAAPASIVPIAIAVIAVFAYCLRYRKAVA